MTLNSISTTFGTNFANDAILDEFYQSRTPLAMFFKIGLRPFIFAEIFVAKLANVIFVGIWFDVIFTFHHFGTGFILKILGTFAFSLRRHVDVL